MRLQKIINELKDIAKGGEGSGNFNHSGRHGLVGGSGKNYNPDEYKTVKDVGKYIEGLGLVVRGIGGKHLTKEGMDIIAKSLTLYDNEYGLRKLGLTTVHFRPLPKGVGGHVELVGGSMGIDSGMIDDRIIHVESTYTVVRKGDSELDTLLTHEFGHLIAYQKTLPPNTIGSFGYDTVEVKNRYETGDRESMTNWNLKMKEIQTLMISSDLYKDTKNHMKDIRSEGGDAVKKGLAVSHYAMYSPDEFMAETYVYYKQRGEVLSDMQARIINEITGETPKVSSRLNKNYSIPTTDEEYQEFIRNKEIAEKEDTFGVSIYN